MRRIALLVFALLLVAAGCGTDDTAQDIPEGFVLETAEDPGPDAFTPPVDTEDDRICDKDEFLAELESRPDAFREWARVLGIPQDEVASYIKGLEPKVLESDLQVTNHGLADGAAYARSSVLEAGTAVLVDADFSASTDGGSASSDGAFVAMPVGNGDIPPDGEEPPAENGDGVVPGDGDEAPPGGDGNGDVPMNGDDEVVPENGGDETPPETGVGDETPPTDDGGDDELDGWPVTRCKCGNPLLPPGEEPLGEDEAPADDETPTDPDGEQAPPTENGDGVVPEDGDEVPPEDGNGEMVPENGGDEAPPAGNDNDDPEYDQFGP